MPGVQGAQERVCRRFGRRKWNTQRGSAGTQTLITAPVLARAVASCSSCISRHTVLCFHLLLAQGNVKLRGDGPHFSCSHQHNPRKSFGGVRHSGYHLSIFPLRLSALVTSDPSIRHKDNCRSDFCNKSLGITPSCSASQWNPDQCPALQIHPVLISLVLAACQLPGPSVHLFFVVFLNM